MGSIGKIHFPGAADLAGLINRHLKSKLTPVAVEAGMHLLAWLPPGINAEKIALAALKEGLILQPISQYCIKCKHANGLILGFAGFSFSQMETAILILRRVLDKP
ncbi:MAG TPA: hypothetical protein VL832_27685 [Puia sp.]|nr:hypothetical protein [Puia sp.]